MLGGCVSLRDAQRVNRVGVDSAVLAVAGVALVEFFNLAAPRYAGRMYEGGYGAA